MPDVTRRLMNSIGYYRRRAWKARSVAAIDMQISAR
jgi:hypothetical protein